MEALSTSRPSATVKFWLVTLVVDVVLAATAAFVTARLLTLCVQVTDCIAVATDREAISSTAIAGVDSMFIVSVVDDV
ncbi:hypothetical protein [Klebsiella aerogenes]